MSLLDIALSVALCISTVITVFIVTLPSQFVPSGSRNNGPHEQELGRQNGPKYDNDTKNKDDSSVQVVVLGDIGHSPRMQYHAISIAKHGVKVQLIGYLESELHPDIVTNSLITVVSLPAAPKSLQTGSRLLFLLLGPLKVLWQVWSLYYALGYRTKPSKWMLVQNPPSIPTLAIAQIICYFRNTRLVIDWHNFGYSILALKLGNNHPLVKASEIYESFYSRSAAFNFAVTDVMAQKLRSQYNIKTETLHDRPPQHFQPLTPEERIAFLTRLPETAKHAHEIVTGSRKLIVSATSWTVDEDFSILLDALVAYSTEVDHLPQLPKILAIITGKGPRKEPYLSKIQQLEKDGCLTNVSVLTAWLTPGDYATLLGAADLGISLHTSSSGVDLPMKVVDMFGTGLPVVGWSKFLAWPELVKEDINGKGFGSVAELQSLLGSLFSNPDRLKRLRDGALQECNHRWDDEWNPVAGRLFHLVDDQPPK
ncbi:glycosyltransferase family 33 protein [Patellaria atrata CBS 101060]|uniref:Chitobiosyldiphosphodolichol beta-mannosyltransferase n=1 Tax=Patellaria atrata CBS 101060 TaxID=1346257 RepID=A0A9P4S440_9PEZI|nr:glycosyltransferase family 33 protein [Patellaria atrata CBS 101060]